MFHKSRKLYKNHRLCPARYTLMPFLFYAVRIQLGHDILLIVLQSCISSLVRLVAYGYMFLMQNCTVTVFLFEITMLTKTRRHRGRQDLYIRLLAWRVHCTGPCWHGSQGERLPVSSYLLTNIPQVGGLPACNHQQVPFAYKMFSRTDETRWQ